MIRAGPLTRQRLRHHKCTLLVLTGQEGLTGLASVLLGRAGAVEGDFVVSVFVFLEPDL